ncbi:hypothetical protein BC827DRAFT_1186536 [Russula dissimulans]|nr:hypothetical protein BC827DRAFT_1186536 [Russula dissimulans]
MFNSPTPSPAQPRNTPLSPKKPHPGPCFAAALEFHVLRPHRPFAWRCHIVFVSPLRLRPYTALGFGLFLSRGDCACLLRDVARLLSSTLSLPLEKFKTFHRPLYSRRDHYSTVTKISLDHVSRKVTFPQALTLVLFTARKPSLGFLALIDLACAPRF